MTIDQALVDEILDLALTVNQRRRTFILHTLETYTGALGELRFEGNGWRRLNLTTLAQASERILRSYLPERVAA